MFIVSSIGMLFIALGFAVYSGNTFFLPDKLQKRVKDKVGYGRAVGSIIIGLGAAVLVSGFVSFFGKGAYSNYLATRILLVSLILAILFFVRAQIKFSSRNSREKK